MSNTYQKRGEFKMLMVNGERYKLTERNGREQLHQYIDQWVVDNYPNDLLNGGLEDELSLIHEYVSAENRKSLEGTWFDKGLVIEYWHEPITDYLDKMDMEYTKYEDGTVGFNYKGKYIVFTRDLGNYDLLKEDNRSEWETKEDRVIEVKEGLISKEELEKLGMSYVKDYYLPKD